MPFREKVKKSRKKWPVLSVPYLTSFQHVHPDPRSPQTHSECFLHKVSSDIRVRHLHKLLCLRGGSVVGQNTNRIWSVALYLSVLLNHTVLYWFTYEYICVQNKSCAGFWCQHCEAHTTPDINVVLFGQILVCDAGAFPLLLEITDMVSGRCVVSLILYN